MSVTSALKKSLLVVDLEATCWGPGEHRPENMETIEIGAVLAPLGLQGEGSAQREFQCFIRPVRSSVLSDFCKQLTGIRQAEVDAADHFPIALARFLEWVGDPGETLLSSWGEYDRKQLRRDCALHSITYPFGEDHLNFKRYFARRLRCRPMGMAEALAKLGLPLEGAHHRGLDDARNILRILKVITGGRLEEVLIPV